jgi:6,7-dimethyl-8-ribityllumazine synthase
MASFSTHEIKVHEGFGSAEGLRFAIVQSRFNDFITAKLLEGALSGLGRAGVPAGSIEVFKVPGAWEMPVVVGTLTKHHNFDAIICLGCVIRGATPHFDYVAGESAKGISNAAAASGIPVLNAILTTNTMEEAIDRSGGKMGNKGFDAAMGAVEMAILLRGLKNGKA